MSDALSIAANDVELALSGEYSLLARLLLQSPDARLLGQLAQLEGDMSPIGLAHAALAEAAQRLDIEPVQREYFNLFVGVGRGELLPYASFYLTGSLHGRPLAALRQTLQDLRIERIASLKEPEDHAGLLCETMAGLAAGTFAAPANASRDFFVEHMAPWMGRLFNDLEQAKSADFYVSVGRLGRTLVELEIAALALPA
jgi:TorA maturation chaperone TorD